MSKHLRVGIAGIVLDLASADDSSQFEIEDSYVPFLTHGQPEVVLRVERSDLLDEGFGETVFDSGGSWMLCRDGRRWGIKMVSPALGSHPYQIAILEPDFASGDIYLKVHRASQELLPFPLRYPLAEVLMINLLSLGKGVLLHACGVNDHGRGLIFAGTSGAGKSTMAGLWKDEQGVTILSDDRVIVREKDGLFWAYGTPWHGDIKLSSPEAVPLDRVFVLRQGGENRAAPLEAETALTSLLVRSFPTYWNPEGMRFILDFLERMSYAAPCYNLDFLPDRSTVDFVRTVGDA